MTGHKVALIADGHEIFRAGLAAMLRSRLGFSHVIEAGNLDKAIEHLGIEKDITFASFDLNMAGVESVVSLQAVRDAFPELRFAIIAGSTRQEDILMALKIGAHGYVPKTLTIEGIVNALRLVLDGQIFVPPCISDPPRVEISATQSELSLITPADGLKLTRRQRDVLACIAQGKSNKEIARILDLADGTVKVHVNALFRALGVHNRVSAASALMQMGANNRYK
ncbi:DNA-binding NarL/FixJ family response regulator [Methylopila capsulata]|uniref:DNA-binding NarL/FixJ family response regulator n=1 Tax=Methylopila capsulata TaxID=61654 RepID=A0A9W6IVX5_9HYPH|nr:response regulator transcription factor [Methylopila capsulata]MBM7852393.1 DNA-binding NarL/FixJ family response regulator [Methylopila capsulata]GLK56602.1 DNA-binding response regulator [Methylopila capsulata]